MDQTPYVSSPPEKATDAPRGADGKRSAVTPMMAQFFEIKAVNPGYLLFYRMGDFYELFFEDAEIASGALGIVLTTRGKHLGEEIPMCGVPVHAAQDYLKKLIRLGHRVAICEQMEAPAEAKKRGSKSVVKRDVVRLVTPGTLTEDDLLPAQANNYLGALSMIRHGEFDFALAWADISTGETFIVDVSGERLVDELARLDLAELIMAPATEQMLAQNNTLPEGLVRHQTVLGAETFESEQATLSLKEVFPQVESASLTRAARSALGALVAYVAKTQKTGTVTLRAPKAQNTASLMQIDLATRHSLEILATNRGETKGSLRHTIDRTLTAAGARLLARRLSAPLVSPEKINKRLDMVETFVADTGARDALREHLRHGTDLTRPLTRLALGRGGPRDLIHIGTAIKSARQLAANLVEMPDLPAGLTELAEVLGSAPTELAQHIEAAVEPVPPLLVRDGGFVREGHDDELDHQRALATKSRTIISELQARLASETDIRALKIKHNKVLGFFVEVPATHGKKLLDEPFLAIFIHRQTMANAMRFTTAELGELEGEIARAQGKALQIELTIFDGLLAEVLNNTGLLRENADALARIDVTVALAVHAAGESWCRPLVDNSLKFDIKNGRHPVVEQTLKKEGQVFVANDCDLSGSAEVGGKNPRAEGGQLWLVTGPNMGGKSTFLRQNALIAILAQIGAYVPAEFAHIGVVDRLFSRVGASDDIARGRSTFMVEMVETAAILNRATNRSLVILDEIGRGTATFDGLSIAWATAEALHESNACRALFATHFHELTALAKSHARVSNHTMKVREWEGEVVFLHEVAAGVADRSYGIQVARLAGLPEEVLERARAVLTLLEQQPGGASAIILDDLPLFLRPVAQNRKAPDPLHEMLDSLHPDELTPLEALDMIYQLKKVRDARSPC